MIPTFLAVNTHSFARHQRYAAKFSPAAAKIPSLISVILESHLLIQPRHSLRSRLLWPLVVVSIAASILVAIVSCWLASRTAERELTNRYRSIAATLESSSFPLNRSVLISIAKLTDTELMTANFDGSEIESTMTEADQDQLFAIVNQSRLDRDDVGMTRITFGQNRYRVGTFRRTVIASGSQSAAWVFVLFNETGLRAALIQAVVAPLATGLSTIALLTTITLALASRLVGRLSRLEKQVARISQGDFEDGNFKDGDFEAAVVSGPPDEIGRLASAVRSMATQLRQMWQTIHQREGERLLHQVAAGLAHNLRNSLTGARMAVELHRKRCKQRDDDGLRIAVHEIEQTESYVQRLLFVAAGKQDVDKPARIVDCYEDLRSSLNPLALHKGIALSWDLEASIADAQVADGPSWVAAVTNLVFNAMHVATQVNVRLNRREAGQLVITVEDNGPGPSIEVQENLFDPFITTKPEGLGLGLPFVLRASRRLGGDVQWLRKDSKTSFILTAKIQ